MYAAAIAGPIIPTRRSCDLTDLLSNSSENIDAVTATIGMSATFSPVRKRSTGRATTVTRLLPADIAN
jgi:hypothetical protein